MHEKWLEKRKQERLKRPLGICIIPGCGEEATHKGKAFGFDFCDEHSKNREVI